MYRITLLLLLMLPLRVFSQPFPQDYFRSPLDIPLYMSGNFAEIRPNHFHGGVDFKTEGVEGKKLFAAAEGYISRISVSPTGYGKAVYINHPNGYTTVYGHMQSFNTEITAAIEKEQYRQQKFKVNLYLKPDAIPVKKGDVIGLSGNSGSSGGPHLHFEIRDTESEHPHNPLLFGLPVKDKLPPVVYNLFVYPVGEHATINGHKKPVRISVRNRNGIYVPSQKLSLFGKIGFGLQSHDFHNGSRNRCGVYSILLQIDDEPKFSFKMVEHAFDETRYINAHIDYATRQRIRSKVHKLFRLPNNRLRIYDKTYGDGIFDFRKEHDIRFSVFDAYGNKCTLRFRNAVGDSDATASKATAKNKHYFEFREENYLVEDDIRIIFPKDAFYDNIDFHFSRMSKPANAYSKIFSLHDSEVPVHKSFDLSVLPENFPARKKDKVCIVRYLKNGRTVYYPAHWINGFAHIRTRYFGNYAVSIDDTAPYISPLKSARSKIVKAGGSISFNVRDAHSGIKKVDAYIDGVWKLYDWDAKRNLVKIDFSETDLTTKRINFSIRVEDYLGNVSTFATEYRTE